MHDFLSQHILQYGPITVDEYLNTVLYHPLLGYYAKDTDCIIGENGDFITAPEISQLFGETIAIRLITHWFDQGCPPDITLIECGPGRGTLMKDVIQTFKLFSNKLNHIEIYMVEASPKLQAMQSRLLSPASINHVKTIDQIPALHTPTYIIANEYFDALPVQHVMTCSQTGHTYNRYIDYDLAQQSFYFKQEHPDLDIHETCPQMASDAALLSNIIQFTNGLGVFIDYGIDSPTTSIQSKPQHDTLQAVFQHQKVSIFDHVGEADISHLVNFNELSSAFKPCDTMIQTQREFLTQWGILEKLNQVIGHTPQETLRHTTAVNRLINPAFMGRHFKVLTVLKTI